MCCCYCSLLLFVALFFVMVVECGTSMIQNTITVYSYKYTHKHKVTLEVERDQSGRKYIWLKKGSD